MVRWIAASTIAFAIVSKNGSQPFALLLLLAVLPALWISPDPRYRVSKVWLWMLLLPLLASVPLFITSGTGEALAAGARYFAAAIVMIALARFELDLRLLLRAASLGGILAILFNLDQLGEMRVDWGVGFLDSGYISVMLLCLALAQFHLDKGRLVWRLFAAVGIACLVVAVMKTGTRGAWPAMILVFSLEFFLLELSRNRKILLGIAGAILLATAMLSMPSVHDRIVLTFDEVEAYYKDNNHATSMGYRLDFWHIAIKCFAESPIWGVSYQRRSKIMAEFIENNPESKTIGTDGRSSSHNEMLDALAKRGILGGIAALLLYLIPMRFFIRHSGSSHSRTTRHLAFAGSGLVLTMVICGITEAPMMNVRVGTSYCFLLVLLYHLIRRQESAGQPALSGNRTPVSAR